MPEPVAEEKPWIRGLIHPSRSVAAVNGGYGGPLRELKKRGLTGRTHPKWIGSVHGPLVSSQSLPNPCHPVFLLPH